MAKKINEKDMDKESEETVDSNLEANKEIFNEQSQEILDEEFIEKLETIKAENEELNNKYLRLSADFQNFKKRVEKEKSDIYNYANEKLVLELLPIIDNFDRAFESSSNEGESESLLKGVEMIQQQFLDILIKNGVTEIPALGEPFDHNFHHAVLQENNPDYESNTVIDVFQKGYTLNGKVIRPSMVKVSN